VSRLALWFGPQHKRAELGRIDQLMLFALRIRQAVRHAVGKEDLLCAVLEVALDLARWKVKDFDLLRLVAKQDQERTIDRDRDQIRVRFC